MLPNNGSIPIFDFCFSDTHTSSQSDPMSFNQQFEDQDHQRWFVMKESQEPEHNPSSSIEEEASTISYLSSSSSASSSSSYCFDTADDASSSAHSSRSSLYDLSDLMSHLPIKRGLSKFYHGKSDSFTSLAKVTSIQDIPKKLNKSHNKKKNKSFRSHTLPKPIISKKNSRKKKFFTNRKEVNAS